MLALGAVSAPLEAAVPSPRLVLHVSLYPYIPEAPAAALALKQGFERLHPEVIVEITFNPHYYSLEPTAKGVLYEEADVHEIDAVFLPDFIAAHRLAPLPADFVRSLDPLMPQAVEAAAVDGRLVAVPQWMCSDFLIYRQDRVDLSSLHRLADLERRLRPDHGLLMNLSGADTLGELYFSTLLARGGDPKAVLSQITDTPDPQVLDRFRRFLALEPPGFGRNPSYALEESFYARQFARGAGAAFVGYSELTHDALEEAALSCRPEDRCVTAQEIAVAAVPLADDKVRPAVWVDMFGIDARVHGRTKTAAEAFIRYAVSDAAYRSLLIPESGEIPRYLLPATRTAFDDPKILAAAPLYPKFRAIIDQGLAVSIPHLSAKLHGVATRIDAALPATP